MGVQGLWTLLSPAGTRIDPQSLRGKRLAIDVSIWVMKIIYGFIAKPNMSSNQFQNIHLIMILRRLITLLELGIKPVFVFDGKPPELKKQTLMLRQEIREKREKNLKKLAERYLVKQLEQKLTQDGIDETNNNNQKNVQNEKFRQELLQQKQELEEIEALVQGLSENDKNDFELQLENHQHSILDTEFQSMLDFDENIFLSYFGDQFKSNQEFYQLSIADKNIIVQDLVLIWKKKQNQKFKQIKDDSQYSQMQASQYIQYCQHKKKLNNIREQNNEKLRQLQIQSLNSDNKDLLNQYMNQPNTKIMQGDIKSNRDNFFILITEQQKKKNDGDMLSRIKGIYDIQDQQQKDKENPEKKRMTKTQKYQKMNEKFNNILQGRQKEEIDFRNFQEEISEKQENERNKEKLESYKIQQNDTFYDGKKAILNEENQKMFKITDLYGTFSSDSDEDNKSQQNNKSEQKSTNQFIKSQQSDNQQNQNDQNLNKDDILKIISQSQTVLNTNYFQKQKNEIQEKEDQLGAIEEESSDNNIFKMLNEFNQQSNETESDQSEKLNDLTQANEAIPIYSNHLQIQKSQDNLDNEQYQQTKINKKKDVENQEKYISQTKNQDINIFDSSSEDQSSIQAKKNYKKNKNKDQNIKKIQQTKNQFQQKQYFSSDNEQLKKKENKIDNLEYASQKENKSNTVINKNIFYKQTQQTQNKLQPNNQKIDNQQLESMIKQMDKEIYQQSQQQAGKQKNKNLQQLKKSVEELDSEADVNDMEEIDDIDIDAILDDHDYQNQNILELEEEFKKYQIIQGLNSETIQDKFEQIKHLLKIFGVPYLEAPSEAEAQCAELELLHLVDGTITDDSDSFLFGCQAVYRGVFSSISQPFQGKRTRQASFLQQYKMNDINKQLGLNREQLIYLAMFLGSDYTLGIKGVGIVNALEILEAFQDMDGLKRFKEWAKSADILLDNAEKFYEDIPITERRFLEKHKNYKKTWELPFDFPSQRVFNAYLNPNVDSSKEKFSWQNPDTQKLEYFCNEVLDFQPEATNIIIQQIKNAIQANKLEQKKITDFFDKETKFAIINSKRILQAVEGIKRKSDPNYDIMKDDSINVNSNQILDKTLEKIGQNNNSNKKLNKKTQHRGRNFILDSDEDENELENKQNSLQNQKEQRQFQDDYQQDIDGNEINFSNHNIMEQFKYKGKKKRL